jgi:outer membrane protein TolC
MIGLMMLPAASAGQAAEQREYDLGECIRAALTSSPDLEAAAADLAAARARLDEARAGRFGQIEYTQILGLANRAHGDASFSPDDKSDFFTGLGPFTRLELDINIPLWTFGKLAAALEAAEHGLNSDMTRRDSRRAEVVLRTKQLYYGLLLGRQLSGVLKEMLETMEKAVKKTGARLSHNDADVTEMNLLELKVGRAKFAKGVIEVEASTALARSALARAIGIPMDAEFDIADRRLRPVPAELETLEAYLAEGPDRRPEWNRLETGIAAQEAKVKVEEADYYPTVFLSTGVRFARAGNRDEQSNPFAYDEFNYLFPVGVLGVRWNLNFVMTKAKVEQANADLVRLRAREREAATGLRLEIRRAYSEVAQASDTIRAVEEGRKAGRGMLMLSVSNFELGFGEAEELFRALGAYTEASTDYFRAVHDYNVAVANLSKAVGKEVTELRY